jgi:sec-independent protein translocase protein TatC
MAELELPGDTGPIHVSSVPDPSQPDPDEGAVMTLVDHLTELRSRLFRAALALVLGTVVGFVVAPTIIDLLTSTAHTHFIVIGIGGGFFIQIKMALVIGVALALPVIVYQLWRFVAPGLTRPEREAIRPWLPLAGVFFGLGVAVAYVVLPFAIGFLGAFTFANTAYTPSLESYFDFVLLLFLAFGLVMEFPIGLFVLARIGILPLERLRSSRRYAFLFIVIFAVVVTPGGDPISPSVMSVVMYVLYEVTIRLLARSEARSAAHRDA